MKRAKIGVNAVIAVFISVCSLTGVYTASSYTPAQTDIKYEKAAAWNTTAVNGSAEEIGRSDTVTIIGGKEQNTENTNRKYLKISGMPFGIKLYLDGVVVAGSEDILTQDGYVNPGETAGLAQGDIITHVNSVRVQKNVELSEELAKCSGKTALLTVEREGNVIYLSFTPVLSYEDNVYKAGLWVKDSNAGIGTVSFFDEDCNMFCGLGHGVCDADTGEITVLSSGEAYTADIIGCKPGTASNIGELSGVFADTYLGEIVLNNSIGVYGIKASSLNENGTLLSDETLIYPLAEKNEVHTGGAQILSSVDSEGPALYDIEIVEIKEQTDGGKNLVINVTDTSLISKTGGIVQGMSGSPIIQNGFLAGVVTHVFVDNPKGGYGIFAKTMYDEMTAYTSGYLKNAA